MIISVLFNPFMPKAKKRSLLSTQWKQRQAPARKPEPRLLNGFCSFAAPETGAADCETGAPGGASSARRDLRDHRSQLRFVGVAVWHVDGVQLVDDGDNAAQLRLSVWERRKPGENKRERKNGDACWDMTSSWQVSYRPWWVIVWRDMPAMVCCQDGLSTIPIYGPT